MNHGMHSLCTALANGEEKTARKNGFKADMSCNPQMTVKFTKFGQFFI